MKKIVKWLGFSTGVAVLVVGGIVLSLYLIINGNGVAKDGYLYIPTGGTYQGVKDSVTKNNLVKNIRWFDITAKIARATESVYPGRYRLTEGMSNITLIRHIKQGRQEPLKLTFNNIRTIDRLAGVVGKQLECDSVALMNLLSSDSVALANGFTKRSFMAMFLPDTYEFYWNTSPEGFIRKMRSEHDAFWSAERRAQLLKTKMNETEVVILASIVYEETKRANEMPRIAGVYINRLNRGIPLQADPTVKFAIGDFSLKRIYKHHLRVDSPYNTYINRGLPPGPIAMPSKTAIDAVLNFEKHNYIYFCASVELSGYHNFASTLAEHTKNARDYSRALNKLNIK